MTLGAEDVARLTSLHDLLAESADPIIDAFYEHLLSFEKSRALLQDPAVVGRLKAMQREHFLAVTGGDYGSDYFESRLRIGVVHERIDLQADVYLGAYHFWLDAVATHLLDTNQEAIATSVASFKSLMKVVFLDIGLAMETYQRRCESALDQKTADVESLYRASELFPKLSSTDSLLSAACELTVERFGARMAWVGLSSTNGARVVPFVSAGHDEGYTDLIQIARDGSPATDGPVGTAIRKGQVVINRPETDPTFEPWRAETIARGYRSAAGFPLMHEEEELGTLNVYSEELDHFSPERVHLCQSLANVAALSLQKLRLYEQVASHTELLSNQVAERTAELLLAKEEAELASQAKTEFLARMTHKLRTPLNAILGFSQLLGVELASEESAGLKIQQIHRSGHHLRELIEDILDLSRIEQGRLPLEAEDIPIAEVLDEVVSALLPIAMPRRIELLDYVSEVGHTVHADRQRLRQVLLNLVSNAVIYNQEDGAVILVAEMTDEVRLRIRVVDTGQGIATGDQRRIFEPFDRLGAEDSGVDGTGIGLVVAKRLMEAMGGAIGFESAPGRGSTFWIDVPVPDEYRAECEDHHGTLPGASAQYTALCVEDDVEAVQLMKEILSNSLDVRVYATSQASAALKLAEIVHPDLIVMDIKLPGMSGLDLMRRLHEDAETADIPVLAVSARAMPADVESGLAAGFRRYFTKPINVDEFLEAVTEVLGIPVPTGNDV